MSRLVQVNDEEVQCSECDAIFTVIWQRSATVFGIEYCPFCGDEVEEPTDDHES